MGFISTRAGRGGAKRDRAEEFSFREAAQMGRAPDGGMLLPSLVPRVSEAELAAWRTLSFPALLAEVLALFVVGEEEEKELPRAALQTLCAVSFAEAAFDVSDVLALSREMEGLVICELFHGPTQAFKDISLVILVRLLRYFLDKDGQKMLLLVGTSGDTGSAAISAVCATAGESEAISIVCLYPTGGRCSRVQEIQMIQASKRMPHLVRLIGVEGSSDDLDVPIEAIFKDTAFCKKHRINSVNSLNVIRLLAQVAHFFWAYFRIEERHEASKGDFIVDFYVPTGAGGNITAGIIAKKMGLGFRRIVASTNENDIICNLLRGESVVPTGNVVRTLSPAMDIAVGYNIERILFLAGCGPEICEEFMVNLRKFQNTGKSVCFPPSALEQLALLEVTAGSATDSQVLETMSTFFKKHDYTIDPHTAVGVHVATTLGASDAASTAHCHRVVLASASCAKFPDACIKAFLSADKQTDSLRREILRLFAREHRTSAESEKKDEEALNSTNLGRTLQAWDLPLNHDSLTAIYHDEASKFETWERTLRDLIVNVSSS